MYQHLAGFKEEHPGREHVRRFEETFYLKGPHGEHLVSVMAPLGMSLRSLQEMQRTRVFQPSLVTSALDQALLGLSFLHQADVIHTGEDFIDWLIFPSLKLNAIDLHSDNLLVAITDTSVLSKVEENEIKTPSARKEVGASTIHVSQYVLGGAGSLTICDLGQARIGSEQHGRAMPLPYRAPEVILNMPWGSAVDVWSLGLLVCIDFPSCHDHTN